METATEQALHFEPSRTLYDEADAHQAKLVAKQGLNGEVVRLISKTKNEPSWMLNKRLRALELFQQTSVPNWGPDLSKLNFDTITYFVDPDAKETNKWEEVPEEIRKTFDRLGIPEAEKKSLAGVGAQYDCLTEDTIVYTNPKGGVKIKDIKVGDCVFALDESNNKIVNARVKGFMDKGIRPVFEVKIKGKKIKTTYNHPFLTLVDKRKPGKQRARYSKEWRYLSELKKGDIIAVATNLPDYGKPFKFKEIKTKSIVKGKNQFGVTYDLDVSHSYKEVKLPKVSDNNLMWLFGHYLGDGYITKAKNKDKMRLHFAVHESQQEIKDKIKEIMNKYFGYGTIYGDKFRISINSTKIALFFKENGFYGKAREKSIPNWVHALPKEQKLALLAGYIDADGTVRKEDKGIDVTSVNWKLLEQVKELSVYCGLTTSKITTFKSGFGRKGHRVSITGRTREIPCVHKTKRERLLSRITNIGKYNSLNGTTIRKYCSDSVGFSRIERISYLGKEKVYDIEVEGHHNFVANGVIVHNSGVVYHQVLQSLKDQGVIFESMDVALQKYPELVKQYFMTSCIPINDHKFIMLHAAVWSGGTFIYIPKGVKVELPLQAYFRMNEKSGGQFEHTLIIVDEGAELHYIEGCSSPQYSTTSLHAGCVELHVLPGATMTYSSIENWSRNVYNLNTKRALVHKNASVRWLNGNMGSALTMLYPCSVLIGENARSENLGIAFANTGQEQDTGSKVIHAAPNTSSIIKAKSISKGGGISSYRGLVKVMPQARNTKSQVQCDALLLDNKSSSRTYPTMKIDNNKVDIGHEATISKIWEEQLFYLTSRGLSEEQALQMIVSGFIGPIIKALPLEYAVELNKLIELEIVGF